MPNSSLRGCDLRDDNSKLDWIKTRLRAANITTLVDNNPTAYTRIQCFKNSTRKSYLDYIFTRDVEPKNFRIGDQIGTSDHKSLEVEIDLEEPIRVAKQKVFNAAYIKK